MKAVNFGIDLGTTNSLIAKYENGKVVLFKNPVGHKESLPSVVAFRKERTLIGDKAREYLLKDPVNVFGGFKRRMGTNDRFYVVNKDENISPAELSAYVLKELKQFVHSGEAAEAAVITIPASFDTMQTNATKKAGKLAGFSKVFLLQEPIAASLAYFNDIQEEKSGYWLAYDLGGGTFDIALVEIKEGEMKVTDHEGNNFLGGSDFDMLLLEQIIVPRIINETGLTNFSEQLMQKNGKYEKVYHQLLYYAEELKKELTLHESAETDFSIQIEGEDYDFYFSVIVEEFNNLIASKINETIRMINSVLDRNGLTSSDINEIILVGGSTLIPYVRTRLQETGISVNTSADPITAIVTGAAYYAANKYYFPKENETTTGAEENNSTSPVAQPQNESSAIPVHEPFRLNFSYSKMSREEEEVLLVKSTGDIAGDCNYRIIRSDGGFDTGLMPLREKLTEFLPLLPNIGNVFHFRVYNSLGDEISSLHETIAITHGQYTTSGQPLPKDICIEIDDTENETTRLDVIFERNSILPLKKTLYKEISKTIKKGEKESIIINILEGNRYARSISNLPVGVIEISGTELESDLIKGSDVEITISMSDNRELTVEAYLVMTRQEFKNVFSISEKNINILRLQEQYSLLESEIRLSLRQFQARREDTWVVDTEYLLIQLESYRDDLFRMKEDDATDKRYIIAEGIMRISQEFDEVGGTERLKSLQEEYFNIKEEVEQTLHSADTGKDELTAKLRHITEAENYMLKSKNPAVLKRSIESLNNLRGDIRANTNSYIISLFYSLQTLPPDSFTSYNAVKPMFSKGQKAIDNERYIELKGIVIDIFNLVKGAFDMPAEMKKDFKGTGIS